MQGICKNIFALVKLKSNCFFLKYMNSIVMLIIAIVLGIAGQLCLKLGANFFSSIDLSDLSIQNLLRSYRCQPVSGVPESLLAMQNGHHRFVRAGSRSQISVDGVRHWALETDGPSRWESVRCRSNPRNSCPVSLG